MIVEYFRPKTIEEALDLITHEAPATYPMGGGTTLNRPNKERFAVVDLQALGLNQMDKQGNSLCVGAMVSLQSLTENEELQLSLREAARRETTYNLRQAASIAGTIVAADGRSRLTGCLLALDSTLDVESKSMGKEQMRVGDLLAMRSERLKGKLITAINIPLNVQLAFECVARTAADEPIVYAAVGQWPSGRTRLVLGGYGTAPMMAMDGPEGVGLIEAAQNAYSQAGDMWASAEYRREMAGILAKRCLEQMSI